METETYHIGYEIFVGWVDENTKWLKISRRNYDDDSYTEHWITPNGLEVCITVDKDIIQEVSTYIVPIET